MTAAAPAQGDTAIIPADGYYLENGSTVLGKVRRVERIYGTRRLIFLDCDSDAVKAQLPAGWAQRRMPGPYPGVNLLLSFNDWINYSHGDNSSHPIVSPRFVGLLVPVENRSRHRSGFMQIYGLAVDRNYPPGAI